ncbi:MAG: V-type ATP synthase subunit E family protein [bacterium]
MTGTSNKITSGSLDSKIHDISEHLKKNVLNPAEEKKEEILKDAEKEKEKILENARKEAEDILKKAEKKAELTKSNMQSSLKIAARQAVDKLKLQVEKKILHETAGKPVKRILSDKETVSKLISDVIEHHFSDKNENISFVLPENTKKAVMSMIKEKLSKEAEKGITIEDDTIPSGFKIVFKDGHLVYDFSSESIKELLSQYMREDLRDYIFAD